MLNIFFSPAQPQLYDMIITFFTSTYFINILDPKKYTQ